MELNFVSKIQIWKDFLLTQYIILLDIWLTDYIYYLPFKVLNTLILEFERYLIVYLLHTLPCN